MEEYNNKIPVVAVVGPTASGKTSFAIEIAKKFDGEIVSLDSMQIYKYLDIGTAKPTRDELSAVPHHMVGVIDPREPFSANDYAKQASKIISDIYCSGKLPVLCGGTGLYIEALLYRFNMSEASFDDKIRDALYKEVEEKGTLALHERLRAVDPKSAGEIHPNNVKRVIRALEIYELTGKPKSEQITSDAECAYDTLIFGMDWERDVLYNRINARVDIMIEAGLVEEVRSLVDSGILMPSSQAYQAIGYKEIIEYFNGACSFDDAVENIKMHSRRYAKRQITWFKRTKNVMWLNPSDNGAMEKAFESVSKIWVDMNMRK